MGDRFDRFDRAGLPGNLMTVIDRMQQDIARLLARPLIVGELGGITQDLGEVRSGRIIAGEGSPEEATLTGTALLYPGWTDGSGNVWHLFGMEAGTLKWGVDSLTGNLVAGTGRIALDNTGLTILSNSSTPDPAKGAINFANSLTGGTVKAQIYGGVGMSGESMLRIDAGAQYIYMHHVIVGMTSTYTMTLSHDVNIGGVVRLTEQTATPSTPDAGTRRLYPRDNGVYELDDAGTEERMAGVKCRLDEPIYPPTGTVTVTAGNVNVGTHSYKLTWVDAQGLETDPSAKSTVITVSSSAKQVTVVTPIGPPGVSQRKLYRTVATDTGDWKLVTTIANNTTTSVTDNTADANLGAAAPAADVTIGRPALPVRAVIWGDTLSQRGADGTAKTIDITVQASQMYGFYGGSVVAGADDGDYFAASIYLAAGTYSTYLLGIKANNQGKFDVYVDGVKINASTYDAYASATAYNTVYAETGVVIAQDGMHLVVVKINGKNASSADYAFRLTKLEFYPVYE